MIIRKNFKHLKIHILLPALAVATATTTDAATHLKIQLCYLIQPFELLNTNYSYIGRYHPCLKILNYHRNEYKI